MAERDDRLVDFSAGIARGEIPSFDLAALDALFHWLVGRDVDPARTIQKGFERQGANREQARQRTLLYLDATLFSRREDPYRLFGLVPDCTLADIRTRHKRLLQVFHPDRHSGDKEWFTTRSEQINRAYAYLKETHGRAVPRARATYSSTSAASEAARKAYPTFSKRSSVAKKTKLRHHLTQYLGSAASAQQRLYIFLFVLPVLLLTVMYFSNYSGHADSSAVVTRSKTVPAGTDDGVSREQSGKSSTTMTETGAAVAKDTTDQKVPGSVGQPETGSYLSSVSSPQTLFDTGLNDDSSGSGPEKNSSETVGQASLLVGKTTNPHPPIVSVEQDQGTGDAFDEYLPDPSDISGAVTRESESERATNDEGVVTDTGPTGSEQKSLPEPDLQPKPEPKPKPKPEQEPVQTAKAEIEDDDNGKDVEQTLESNDTETKNPATSDTNNTERIDNDTTREPGQAKSSNTVLAKSTGTDDSNDIEIIQALLEEYRNAYQKSEVEKFATLFTESAQTVHSTGRSEIKEKYGEFFRKTDRRSVSFENVRISLLGGRQFKVLADYAATWTYPGGTTKSNTGKFDLHLVPEGRELKIWRLKY